MAKEASLTPDEVLQALYGRFADWLDDLEEGALTSGGTFSANMQYYLRDYRPWRGAADISDERALELLREPEPDPKLLIFFWNKCPHARGDFMRNVLPPYPWRDGGPVEPNPPVEPKPKVSHKGKRRGRQPMYDPKKDEKLALDWQAAKACGSTRDEFARESGISLSDLVRTLDRVRSRRN